MVRKIYHDLEQGTDEWLQARCGILTASTIGKLLTPTGKSAKNDKSRRLILDLLAQRISKVVEDQPNTFAMQRGHEDEIEAKLLYAQNFGPVSEAGFITEDRWGFKLGYSPDGLVGDVGLLECKSRAHGLQMGVICDQVVPTEYMAQIQTGLLVSGREWLDFISFPAMGGGKMLVKRVYPDTDMQGALVEAAASFEAEIKAKRTEYEKALLNPDLRFLDTEKRAVEEDILVDG
ncbi:lambda exonuclease family protein [Neokomagataea anthophila]|uniref:YqaJ viral recombinase family protein n=1 Tax=Neokomagataea anthophila TaxID=2826925 RepID=A0ABS5E843_9PROT|nr:lambda exonuclease family protein [Neokomagataea anthophila]MBR0560079.1 YqaJ viral recombinase family protein [Neokomagataea anthophila]